MYSIGHYVYGLEEDKVKEAFIKFFSSCSGEELKSFFKDLVGEFVFDTEEELEDQVKKDIKYIQKNLNKKNFWEDFTKEYKDYFSETELIFNEYSGDDSCPNFLICSQIESFDCFGVFEPLDLTKVSYQEHQTKLNETLSEFPASIQPFLSEITPKALICFSTS